MTEEHRFEVAGDQDSMRLDRFLAGQGLPVTRNRIKQHIEAGACQVNGEQATRPALKLHGGDLVCYRPPPPEPSDALPEQIPLDVLHEDDQVVVLDKPAGMVVHPSAGHRSGTLVNALLGRYGAMTEAGGAGRPGIVHRLDKDTSGVMVAARTDQAHAALAAQFSVHSVERRYLVLVLGNPGREGTFDTLHGRHPRHRMKFSSRVRRGRRAVTHYRLLERLGKASLMEATLQTGRTHQVRVHFSDAGHPVLGDQVYARAHRDPLLKELGRQLGRQALHARVLAFDHPDSEERVRFEAPPPADMQQVLDRLRLES